MTPDSNGNGNYGGSGGVRDVDRMSLMSGATANTSVGAPSASLGHISWHGHSFQPMTFRITNAICEACGVSCSDLRSPPPALECVRCRMRIHRNHVENHDKFVVCPKTVRQWIIRAPSAAERNIWISQINQSKREVANELSMHSPAPLTNRSNFPMTPTFSASNTLRYRSMRNFGGIHLKDIASRRSSVVTFPRHPSTPSVSGATATAVPNSPPSLPDNQHDI